MGGGDTPLPNFPKKRCSAGALIRNESDQLLFVKPSYRTEWLLPGGVVEANEDPLSAVRREVLEEIGLEIEVRSLWCVDYLSTQDGFDEAVHFLFDCASLPKELAHSVLPRDPEIVDVRWMKAREALPFLPPSTARRLLAPSGYLLNNGDASLAFAAIQGIHHER